MHVSLLRTRSVSRVAEREEMVRQGRSGEEEEREREGVGDEEGIRKGSAHASAAKRPGYICGGSASAGRRTSYLQIRKE